MLNRKINPMETTFDELSQLMKAKAELTIEHAIAAIECHVEQLEEDVFSDRPSYGCNIAERVERHKKVKEILTEPPVWSALTHEVMAKIHYARTVVDEMLTEVYEERHRLGGLIGHDPPTLDEHTNDESIKELKFIEENLATGPDDPDYGDIV